MSELPKIPSEYIEPYLQKFLVFQIESVGTGLITPAQAREYLKGVDYFAGAFCGLHASLATSNEYKKFMNMSDEKMIEICQETIRNSVGNY